MIKKNSESIFKNFDLNMLKRELAIYEINMQVVLKEMHELRAMILEMTINQMENKKNEHK